MTIERDGMAAENAGDVSHQSKGIRRPRLVTWLVLLVLWLSSLNLVRFGLGIGKVPLSLGVPAWYLPLTGALWGGCGLIACWGMLRGWRWAPRWTRVVTIAYLAWYWLDRLILARTDYHARSWPIALVASVVGAGFVVWVLRRASARAFFKETSP